MDYFPLHREVIHWFESSFVHFGIPCHYYSVHTPSLVLYSLIIGVISLVSFLIRNILDIIDYVLLFAYTLFTRRIHLPKHRTPRQFVPSISFMGGGHLWMFAIGVGHYIYENYEIEDVQFLASSCGCFAAVPLACGLDPYAWCKRDWDKCMKHYDSRLLGCLLDSKYFYYHLWDDYLPSDAHIRCSGRLFVSITEFPTMRNQVISHFETRQELIWVLVASMCLPIVFILDFPVNCGNRLGYFFDGGFSNDSPCLDSYTITVSALHQEADIKPTMISDYDRSVGIRVMDVICTPSFNRVWQVGNIGERSAANCLDFERHEWISRRRKTLSSSTSDTSSSSSMSDSRIIVDTVNKLEK